MRQIVLVLAGENPLVVRTATKWSVVYPPQKPTSQRKERHLPRLDHVRDVGIMHLLPPKQRRPARAAESLRGIVVAELGPLGHQLPLHDGHVVHRPQPLVLVIRHDEHDVGARGGLRVASSRQQAG
jgi:hypothetical protein